MRILQIVFSISSNLKYPSSNMDINIFMKKLNACLPFKIILLYFICCLAKITNTK